MYQQTWYVSECQYVYDPLQVREQLDAQTAIDAWAAHLPWNLPWTPYPWLIWKLENLGLDTYGAHANSSHLAASKIEFQVREKKFYEASSGGRSSGRPSGGGFSGGPSGGGFSGGPSGGGFSGGPSGGFSGGPSGGPSGGGSGRSSGSGGGNDGGGGGGGGGSSGSDESVVEDESVLECDFESPAIELCFQLASVSALKQLVASAPSASGIRLTLAGVLVHFEPLRGYVDVGANDASNLLDQIVASIQRLIKSTPRTPIDFYAAGRQNPTITKRLRAANNITSQRVRAALVSLRTRDGPITLDAHGGVCSLRGPHVIQLDSTGRPQLVERSPEHLCSLLAGGDTSWLAPELSAEQQALADQINVADYIPNYEACTYILNLYASTLFSTSAVSTKLGVILVGGTNAGKTSLSNLLGSAAGEYAGKGESTALNQSKGATSTTQTRLSNASGGRQFALMDELPPREQFCWLKYKTFTSGFSIQRPINANSTTLITEETPMLLIACNPGQLPHKPAEDVGVLDKVCLLTTQYPLHTAHYSLLTTHCAVHVTHYSLLTTYCALLTTQYPLLTTHYSSPITHYPLPTTQLPTTNYSLLTTYYSLLTTHYSLLTTHYSLLATRYSLLTTPLAFSTRSAS